MLDVTTGLDDDVHCVRCGATRFWHEDDVSSYCEGFVVPSWDYREPTRIDDIDALLARVAEELTVGKAKDPISPDEQAKINAETNKKSSDLFKSLQKAVHNPDKDKGKK